MEVRLKDLRFDDNGSFQRLSKTSAQAMCSHWLIWIGKH